MLIPLDLLLEKYRIPKKGVIHVGAHQAEEAQSYENGGFRKVVWIEGNTELIPFLENKLNNFKGQVVYEGLIDVEEKEVDFFVTNDPQSSSLYDLKEHLDQYPSVKVEKQIRVKTNRLDSFLKKHHIHIQDYNFLNLDIQGNELNAIKSLGEELSHINYIYTEVQVTQLYKNSFTLPEMDQYLFSKGFTRVELDLKYRSWGDAFYTRDAGNSFNNKIMLLVDRWRVASWPLRKKFFRGADQLKYFIKKFSGK